MQYRCCLIEYWRELQRVTENVGKLLLQWERLDRRSLLYVPFHMMYLILDIGHLILDIWHLIFDPYSVLIVSFFYSILTPKFYSNPATFFTDFTFEICSLICASTFMWFYFVRILRTHFHILLIPNKDLNICTFIYHKDCLFIRKCLQWAVILFTLFCKILELSLF